MGAEWATMDTVGTERDLHVKGTRLRGGGKIDFWMFDPPVVKPCRVRCGICKQGMDGYAHCPRCFLGKQVEQWPY
jgi:hypothetical protein